MRIGFLLLVATAVYATNVEWWKTALIYQIYPRSFKDSNGDGIGDLNGIKEKLAYLRGTGVDAIWLSPIYLSPNYDFGYDVTNYRQIAPEYGTMEDFKKLLSEAKSLGIRVILDFVPNHTSNESDWFVRSARREPGYEDYYVWADGVIDSVTGELKPPNNWVSNFRKSAWKYSPERQQFYLHQFAIGQPDLNYRSDKVQQEMKDTLRFWLDMNVSGFRVDAINRLYEVNPEDFGGVYPDEPLSGLTGVVPDDFEYLTHIYTQNLPENYEVVYNWRDLLDEYTEKDGEYKIMITEAYTNITNTIRYYGANSRNGSIPFNFSFLEEITKNSNATDIKRVIDKWMTYMPNGKTATWVNGNHDISRLASRLGPERVDDMNMLALILPGIAVTYQGEEIGMTDGYVSWEDTRDPQGCNTDDPINYIKKSRDPSRTPYHWDSSSNAGFSTTQGKTWLPVADNYNTINLADQINTPKSHYHFYKDVAAIRNTPAVKHGSLDVRALSESVLTVLRLLADSLCVLAIVNLSHKDQSIDLSSLQLLPDSLKVVATGVNCQIHKGTLLTKGNIPVSGHCTVLLQTISSCQFTSIYD